MMDGGKWKKQKKNNPSNAEYFAIEKVQRNLQGKRKKSGGKVYLKLNVQNTLS